MPANLSLTQTDALDAAAAHGSLSRDAAGLWRHPGCLVRRGPGGTAVPELYWSATTIHGLVARGLLTVAQSNADGEPVVVQPAALSGSAFRRFAAA